MSAASFRIVALAFALALLGAACPREKRAGGSGPPGDQSRCEKLRPKIESIYRAEAGDPSDKATRPELSEEILRANTHMVLEDCKTDPDRFVSCIEKASGVEQLESECLIPLDDEGKVEGRRFGSGG